MHNLKISVITVCLNACETIEACVASVTGQIYPNVQYIIIDGGSTDGTINILEKYRKHIHEVVSEKDGGIYDAINKGLAIATGDIIGILNADDFFTDDHALEDVADAFSGTNADILYADLDYVNRMGEVVRKWRSGIYKSGIFNKGWMPPHPTFYCKRQLYNRLGNYKLDFGTAADYELMLRFMHLNKTTAIYLQKVLVKMTVGGASNSSFYNRLQASRNDLKAMYQNQINFPLITLFLKPIRKIKQFF